MMDLVNVRFIRRRETERESWEVEKSLVIEKVFAAYKSIDSLLDTLHLS